MQKSFIITSLLITCTYTIHAMDNGGKKGKKGLAHPPSQIISGTDTHNSSVSAAANDSALAQGNIQDHKPVADALVDQLQNIIVEEAHNGDSALQQNPAASIAVNNTAQLAGPAQKVVNSGPSTWSRLVGVVTTVGVAVGAAYPDRADRKFLDEREEAWNRGEFNKENTREMLEVAETVNRGLLRSCKDRNSNPLTGNFAAFLRFAQVFGVNLNANVAKIAHAYIKENTLAAAETVQHLTKTADLILKLRENPTEAPFEALTEAEHRISQLAATQASLGTLNRSLFAKTGVLVLPYAEAPF